MLKRVWAWNADVKDRAKARKAAQRDYDRANPKPVKPTKPEQAKPVIVKQYQGFGSNRKFEREAGELSAKGYVVQSVTSKGQQITNLKTKESSIGLGFGAHAVRGKSAVMSTDGALVVTYALTEQRQADLAAQREAYTAQMGEYESAMATWTANRPT